MTGVLSIDFETRSTVDLRDTGVYPYAAHPTTDIWCMAWAFDDEDVEVWFPPDQSTLQTWEPLAGLPHRIINHIADGGEIRAWNAQFERIMWREVMRGRYGAPTVKDEQWVCTMAESAAMALPLSLDQAARVIGVTEKKDVEGYSLMMRMCRPRSTKADGTPVWWDVPERVARLAEYCTQDVRTERAIAKALRRLTPLERETYLLDQRINDRGVLIDVPLIKAAAAIARTGADLANDIVDVLTEGAVRRTTDTGALRKWLNVNSVDKAAVRDMLSSELAPDVRRVLEARAESGKSSVAKLVSMLEYAGADNRMRGLYQYHAASTGRWGGRGPQPQNFPRGEVKDVVDYIPAILAGDYSALDLVAAPLSVVSALLRSTLISLHGHDLVCGDYSAVEARVLNWFAGQSDIIRLFTAGVDVYAHNAVSLFGLLPGITVTPEQRQTGKFQELGCGFGMGKARAVSAAKEVYKLELSPENAETIVLNYRATHKFVVSFWYEMEVAAMDAVREPGKSVEVGGGHLGAIGGARPGVTFLCPDKYLYMMLPARRPLVYAAPRIDMVETPWGEMREGLTFCSLNSITRKWERTSTWGGTLAENAVQATARDLQAQAALRLEKAGYPIVLHSHDELVAEVPKAFGSLEEFLAIMAAVPDWARGLPVAATGWRGERYRKS